MECDALPKFRGRKDKGPRSKPLLEHGIAPALETKEKYSARSEPKIRLRPPVNKTIPLYFEVIEEPANFPSFSEFVEQKERLEKWTHRMQE